MSATTKAIRTRSGYSKEQLEQWKREINAGVIIATRVNMRRENAEWVGLCPFRAEKTPSFKVYKNDEGVWLFKCFGCQETGNVFQFVERFDKISFPEAVKKVLEQADTIDPADVEAPARPKTIVTFPLAQYTQCEDALETSSDGQKWITDRGITMEIARKAHLGFVQDAVAVCGTSHPWRDKGWVTIPTLSDDGATVLSVKYRSLVAKKSEDGIVSGILRAQNTATVLYKLGALSEFGGGDLFICEGEPDTLVLFQTGTPAVGIIGAGYKLTPEDIAYVMQAGRIFIAGDNDAAGKKKSDSLWAQLKGSYKIQWPDGIKDANELLLKCGDPGTFAKLLDQLKIGAVKRGVCQENAKESSASEPPTACVTVTADSIKPKRVKWLWLDRVPQNKITLFTGNPDNGKSLATLDVAARVSTGSPFPDGVSVLPASEVLMMIGEDDLEDTVIPRLMAAHADLKKIHFLETIVSKDGLGHSEIRLDENMPNIEASFRTYPDARLLVIDPISNYLGRASMVAEQEVRDKILIPLKRLATKYKIAIILVMHLNKKSDLEAISRVGGAMAFVGVARASWLFSRDADGDDKEKKDAFSMSKIKNNLTKASTGGTAFHVDVRAIEIPDDDGEAGTVLIPYIVWDGAVQMSADDVMASHRKQHEEPGRPEGSDKKTQHAIHWLQNALADGHILSEKIFEMADEEEGIKQHTLRLAGHALGIKPKQLKNVGWVWELPPMNATAAALDAAGAQDERAGTDGELLPLEMGKAAVEVG